MIVESGWDLYWIARATFTGRSAAHAPLVAIVCNADLRVIAIEPFDAKMSIDEVLDRVDALHPREPEPVTDDYFDVAYVALARPNDRLPPHDLPPERWDAWDHAIEARRWKSLGLLDLDDEAWRSSGPMHDFKDYPGDYPLARVVRGPHDTDCRCPVCETDRDRIRTLRAHVQENVQ